MPYNCQFWFSQPIRLLSVPSSSSLRSSLLWVLGCLLLQYVCVQLPINVCLVPTMFISSIIIPSMRPPSGSYLFLNPPHRMPRLNFPMIFRITNLSWRLYHVRLLTSLHATLLSALLPPLPSRRRIFCIRCPLALCTPRRYPSHPPPRHSSHTSSSFLSLIPHPLVARSFFLYLLSFVFVSFLLLFIVRLSGFSCSSLLIPTPSIHFYLLLCRMSHRQQQPASSRPLITVSWRGVAREMKYSNIRSKALFDIDVKTNSSILLPLPLLLFRASRVYVHCLGSTRVEANLNVRR